MQTLKLDDNNNLVLNQNSLVILDNIEACAQDTRTRIALFKGEDFTDTTRGISYFDNVLGVYVGQDDIKNQIKKRILDNPEIYSINRINLTKTDNKVQLNTEINSIYGVLEL